MVPSVAEANLDTTRVPLRASMVVSVFDNGCCGVAGLETLRIRRSAYRPDSVHRSACPQWNVVVDILRYAEAGFSVCRDTDSVGNDTYNPADLLAIERHRWRSFHTVSCLGVFRRSFELHDLAVE